MKKNTIKDLINDFVLKSFTKKTNHNVGIELEFAITNLNGYRTDKVTVNSLMEYLVEEHNCTVVEREHLENKIIKIKNTYGDILSLEGSYNIFEFAMHQHKNIINIKTRFDEIISCIQKFLKKKTSCFNWERNPSFF